MDEPIGERSAEGSVCGVSEVHSGGTIIGECIIEDIVVEVIETSIPGFPLAACGGIVENKFGTIEGNMDEENKGEGLVCEVFIRGTILIGVLEGSAR